MFQMTYRLQYERELLAKELRIRIRYRWPA
jgi:hypothetical protein